MIYYKIFVIVVIFVCYSTANPSTIKDQENEIGGNNIVCVGIINKVLKQVQTKLKNGFDPLNVEHVDINLNDSIATIQGTLDQVEIKQLSNFIPTNITCNGLKEQKVNLSLVFQSINMTGLYDLNGFIIGVIPVWGKGNFSIDFTNLIISMEATVTAAQKLLNSLDVQVTLELLKTDFDKLMGGGYYQDMYNRMISDLGPKGVDFYWALYEQKIDEILLNFINNKILDFVNTIVKIEI